MRRREKLNEPKENLDRWLLTYADLITLLLAFFVVMYSMSQIDAKKFGKVAQALHGVLKGGENIFSHDPEQKTQGHGLLKLGNLRMLQARIDEKFRQIGRSEDIQTEVTERGLVVHILESALFRQGSAHLQPRAMEVLDLIYDNVRHMPNHIRVEGHTDDRPINTPLYPSNWELSSARAIEVVRYFVNNHGAPPDRISALGYGEFRPVRPNNSIENRATNRRVDVVVLTMEMSLKEPTSQLYYLSAAE
ncbi:MAG TPA: flagellar motor protein MotB [Candidatus Deferrimicrobium sp.]|nr:flagellar motor protein MotB [Candidatus Deferrimicrobium sp.]